MRIRLDHLVGRNVLTANNRRFGRLEEFRAERRDGEWVVVAYVIGAIGLLERLGVGARMLAGMKRGGFVARWDQLDLSSPDRPRLSCSVDELTRV
jgi:hypothetical protein